MIVQFSKMHGLGNDFVVLDNIRQALSMNGDLARRIADRRYGVGCDQLLLVQASTASDIDFSCRIYNANGDEVEQCGNGVRCVARFLTEQGLTEKTELTLSTVGGVVHLQPETLDRIRVNMGVPVLESENVPFLGEGEAPYQSLVANGLRIELGAVSMGNPHAVTTVNDVTSAPVERLGPEIGRHQTFPQGVNVGFVETIDREQIKLRVFERGAGETLACGSGACAAVVVGRLRNDLGPRVSVELPGGKLDVEWKGRGNPVFMTGPAAHVFEGQMKL